MIQKIKDYVTWGEVDEKVYNSLVEKKGEVYTRRLSDRQGKIKYNRFIEVSGRKIKKYFRLNSPKKGFGRKGIKVSFVKGGGLGYRKDKINGVSFNEVHTLEHDSILGGIRYGGNWYIYA